MVTVRPQLSRDPLDRNMIMTSDETILVVIDAQRAFVDPAGSLMRAFGPDEVRPGVEALGRLLAYLAERGSRGHVVFVRSEYRRGQFTGGQLTHPLADLCVPGRNVDCEWAVGLDVLPHQLVVTKHQADAGESAAFRAAIERVVQDGARRIAMVGFQLTTCVEASAKSTRRLVSDRGVQVVVVESLTGVRASSRYPASGLSRVEATRQRLEGCGVLVIRETEQAV